MSARASGATTSRTLLSACQVLVAFLFAAAPQGARADGYNTWPGGLVGWGDLEMSPQLEVTSPTEGRSSLPWMLQAGLTQDLDLALNLGLDLEPDGASLQPMSLMPRLGVGVNGTAGLGLGWSIGPQGPHTHSVLAVLTWAWEPGGAWRGDSNLFATLPLKRGQRLLTFDGLVHIERRLVGAVSAVFEVNVQVAELGGAKSVTSLAFLGVFLKPQPCDCVTVAAGYPIVGHRAHPREIIVGAWWNHVLDLGFGDRACRRDGRGPMAVMP